MKKHGAVLILCLLCVALVTGLGLAWNSADFRIPWDVMPDGGSRMSSVNYASESSMSQTAIGLSGSASYQMGAGYWYGIELEPPVYDVYLPMVR
jgi:hypothetical protein